MESQGEKDYCRKMVGLHEWRKAHETAIDANKKHVQEKQQKVAMIEVAHAVVHPCCKIADKINETSSSSRSKNSKWKGTHDNGGPFS